MFCFVPFCCVVIPCVVCMYVCMYVRISTLYQWFQIWNNLNRDFRYLYGINDFNDVLNYNYLIDFKIHWDYVEQRDEDNNNKLLSITVPVFGHTY